MIAFAHAKINLGLHVVSKRSDGFHEIETCFYPLPLADLVEVIPADTFSFSQSGLDIPLGDNLCVRAYDLLRKESEIPPARIHLHKIIPVGAGLGGGSSDGAFTLRLLNTVFGLKLSIEKLKKLAAGLGSDCSFFVEDRPMIGTGRGEVLSPSDVNLRGQYLVLAKPPVQVSTAEAYAGITPRQPVAPLARLLTGAAWRDQLTNDFEASVFEKYPAIKAVKERLYDLGARFASMTGSGSAVYGIFSEPIDAREFFPDTFYWSGELK